MKTIITIVLSAAALALVFWVARPVWSDIQNLRAEQAAVSDALARLTDLQGLRDELLKTYNSIPKSKLDRLNDFLPEKPDSGNILVMLEKLTRDRGIRLRRAEFAKDLGQQQSSPGVIKRNEAPYSQIVYNFTVSASYESFRSFLAALEKNLRIVDVTDITFTGGSSNLFEFTLKAKSYYQK